jgi:hypothetical protein
MMEQAEVTASDMAQNAASFTIRFREHFLSLTLSAA